jgi:hypothetical protein
MPTLASEILSNQEHSTNYIRSYSGDLQRLVKQKPEQPCISGYGYVDSQELRCLLAREGFISEAELSIQNGVNGGRFWLFYGDEEKHVQTVKELWDEERKKVHFKNDPLYLKDQEFGLVTSAFVMTRKRGARGFYYDSVKPENFDSDSVLRVSTKVYFRPKTFEEFTEKRFSSKEAISQVNAVLTELRDKVHQPKYGGTQVHVSFGWGLFGDLEGVNLRLANWKAHRAIGPSVLPSLKTIFSHSAFQEAVLIRQELDGIQLPNLDSGHEDRRRVRRRVLEEQANLRKTIEEREYAPAVEAAVKELGKIPQVVTVLNKI